MTTCIRSKGHLNLVLSALELVLGAGQSAQSKFEHTVK